MRCNNKNKNKNWEPKTWEPTKKQKKKKRKKKKKKERTVYNPCFIFKSQREEGKKRNIYVFIFLEKLERI